MLKHSDDIEEIFRYLAQFQVNVLATFEDAEVSIRASSDYGLKGPVIHITVRVPNNNLVLGWTNRVPLTVINSAVNTEHYWDGLFKSVRAELKDKISDNNP